MKKIVYFLLIALCLPIGLMAQSVDDDLYFVPSKDKKEKKETTPEKKEPKRQVTTNIYTSPGTTVVVQDRKGKTRDVDEYNRRYDARENEFVMENDTLYIKEKAQPDLEGEWVTGEFDGSQEDYEYAERIIRFRNPRFAISISSPLYWDVVYGPNSWNWNVYTDGMYAYAFPTFSNPLWWDWRYNSYGWGWNYGWGWGGGGRPYGRTVLNANNRSRYSSSGSFNSSRGTGSRSSYQGTHTRATSGRVVGTRNGEGASYIRSSSRSTSRSQGVQSSRTEGTRGGTYTRPSSTRSYTRTSTTGSNSSSRTNTNSAPNRSRSTYSRTGSTTRSSSTYSRGSSTSPSRSYDSGSSSRSSSTYTPFRSSSSSSYTPSSSSSRSSGGSYSGGSSSSSRSSGGGSSRSSRR